MTGRASKFLRAALPALLVLAAAAGGCRKPDPCVQRCVSDAACIEQLRGERLLEKDAATDETKCESVCRGHRMNVRGTDKAKSDPCLAP